MIVLRTPKCWTGQAEVDGLPVEGTWRAPAPAGAQAGPTIAGGSIS
jgi:xylulose-5-phosphate/fructose-6-phosphate phosphoketolase